MAIAIVNIPERLEVFTYEDYLQLPDNGKRYEIIKGDKLIFHAILDKTQTLTTPLLPGLKISLEKIFQK